MSIKSEGVGMYQFYFLSIKFLYKNNFPTCINLREDMLTQCEAKKLTNQAQSKREL
jgi:hypothetical protein